MEREFRIPERLENIGIDGKIGIGAGMVGFLGGAAFDLYALQRPSQNIENQVAALRNKIANINSLYGDLNVVPLDTQIAVQDFIAKDTEHTQAEINHLSAGQPSSPNAYLQGIAIVGPAIIAGILGAVASRSIRDWRAKRVAEKERKLEIELTIDREVEKGLEDLEWYANKRRPNEEPGASS